MRGGDRIQSAMFSYLSPETRVRKEHPLRAIRGMVDSALGEMSPLFDDMYSELGRAIAEGRDPLKRTVPVFRGKEQGRASLGCNGIHQEPGPAIGTQRREGVFRAGVAAGRAGESDFGRAFHRGR